MKAMGKSALHLAVAATFLGALATTAQAAEVSRSNTGQALIFPYYTVQGNWVTTFNVMNTSGRTLAVKVRFHERKNSRDVLDFDIVLSPHDAWTGWVDQTKDGQPTDRATLHTSDKSCTAPQVIEGAQTSAVAYTAPFDDGGGTSFNRALEGYVEVLLMGVAPKDAEKTDTSDQTKDATYVEGSLAVPYNAKHVNGVPRDCAKVDQAFVATAPDWQTGGDPLSDTYKGTIVLDNGSPGGQLNGSGDPPARLDFGPIYGMNPLKGNVTWLNVSTGAGAGSQAIPVTNYSDENWVTAQQFPWFLEPTFATDPGCLLQAGPADGSLWTVTGLQDKDTVACAGTNADGTPQAHDGFDSSVAALNTYNEWANNPATGASIDWVVTFPTKAYHVDKFNDQIQAAVSKYRAHGAAVPPTPIVPGTLHPVVSSDASETLANVNACNADRSVCQDIQPDNNVGVNEVAPFAELFGVQAALEGLTNQGDSRIPVKYTLYDREENTQSLSGTTISPAPPPETGVLRFEANVLQFGAASVLGSGQPSPIDAAGMLNGAQAGWVNLDFNKPGEGLPVTAFAVKVRTQGEASSNYGQAMDNGYSLP